MRFYCSLKLLKNAEPQNKGTGDGSLRAPENFKIFVKLNQFLGYFKSF